MRATICLGSFGLYTLLKLGTWKQLQQLWCLIVGKLYVSSLIWISIMQEYISGDLGLGYGKYETTLEIIIYIIYSLSWSPLNVIGRLWNISELFVYLLACLLNSIPPTRLIIHKATSESNHLWLWLLSSNIMSMVLNIKYLRKEFIRV